MASDRWRVFLDANVIIAGVASRTGASAAILDLGEAEEIRIVMSRQVLVEADRTLEAKFPVLAEGFRHFVRNLAPDVVDDPVPEDVSRAEKVIHVDDAPILAAALGGDVDFLVSLDTRHFHAAAVKAYFPKPIFTPAEFLGAFRAYWEKSGM
ncbi:MAG: PIN domain-containing protein [Planctomycetota bacterium]